MKFDWTKYRGKEVRVTLSENYGVVTSQQLEEPVYEIVFKVGILQDVFDDGLLLLNSRENILVFVPYAHIKLAEIVQ